MNIRQEIKKHLKQREYVKAINFLQNNCNKEETKHKLNSVLKNYQHIEKEMNQSSIDSTAYYYKINQVVMDTLDLTDEIVGSTDEDWDFIDDLVSSLKFNLIDIEQKEDNEQMLENNLNKASSINQYSTQSEIIDDINSKISLLSKQLEKYENLSQNAKSSEEVVKYQSIIQAINSQIFEYMKKR